jgi:hypothetical protein
MRQLSMPRVLNVPLFVDVPLRGKVMKRTLPFLPTKWTVSLDHLHCSDMSALSSSGGKVEVTDRIMLQKAIAREKTPASLLRKVEQTMKIALSLENKGNISSSIESFENILALLDHNEENRAIVSTNEDVKVLYASALNGLGNLLLLHGTEKDTKRALGLHEKFSCLKMLPDDVRLIGWMNIGVTHMQSRNWHTAVFEFEKVLSWIKSKGNINAQQVGKEAGEGAGEAHTPQMDEEEKVEMKQTMGESDQERDVDRVEPSPSSVDVENESQGDPDPDPDPVEEGISSKWKKIAMGNIVFCHYSMNVCWTAFLLVFPHLSLTHSLLHARAFSSDLWVFNQIKLFFG